MVWRKDNPNSGTQFPTIGISPFRCEDRGRSDSELRGVVCAPLTAVESISCGCRTPSGIEGQREWRLMPAVGEEDRMDDCRVVERHGLLWYCR